MIWLTWKLFLITILTHWLTWNCFSLVFAALRVFPRMRLFNKLISLLILILIFGILLVIMNIYELQKVHEEQNRLDQKSPKSLEMYTNKIYSKERVSEKPSPVVWIHGKKVKTWLIFFFFIALNFFHSLWAYYFQVFYL